VCFSVLYYSVIPSLKIQVFYAVIWAMNSTVSYANKRDSRALVYADSVTVVYCGPKKIWKIKEINGSLV
jgi:hypothetical protein